MMELSGKELQGISLNNLVKGHACKPNTHNNNYRGL